MATEGEAPADQPIEASAEPPIASYINAGLQTPSGGSVAEFHLPPQFQPHLTPPVAMQIHHQQTQVWQSQFPPPDAIERYVAVQPDAFDRILSMAEKQQASYLSSVDEARSFQRDDIRRGHWLGAGTTAVAVAGAITCAFLGQTVVALALVGVPVISVAKALIDSATARMQVKAIAAQPTE